MATATLGQQPLHRWYQLTSFQGVWVLSQFAVLAGAAGWQLLAQPDSMSLLWTDPLGIKMATIGLLLTFVNFLVLVGGSHGLNMLSASSLRDRPQLGNLLQGLLYAGCLLLCYLPALFVLLAGPAAISIQNSLLSP